MIGPSFELVEESYEYFDDWNAPMIEMTPMGKCMI
jgi:hypothetical protein